MKLVNDKKQILSKAMVLYIQDFPALTFPFTILPNSNAKRKSGFLMPTFGHSSETGTWIEDFGYYYAPNDYYDILTTIDFSIEVYFKILKIISVSFLSVEKSLIALIYRGFLVTAK